jgi:hypothetical protein
VIYLGKAREFVTAAEESLRLGNRIAATGNAVIAGIASADAISAARAGVVWQGEHLQAARHVENVGGSEGSRAAAHLRKLVPLKNRAEYDPSPIEEAVAKRSVQAALRILAIAEAVVGDPPA